MCSVAIPWLPTNFSYRCSSELSEDNWERLIRKRGKPFEPIDKQSDLSEPELVGASILSGLDEFVASGAQSKDLAIVGPCNSSLAPLPRSEHPAKFVALICTHGLSPNTNLLATVDWERLSLSGAFVAGSKAAFGTSVKDIEIVSNTIFINYTVAYTRDQESTTC